MKKLVFCDLDGTLLDGGGKLSEKTRNVLSQLNDELVEFVVATGRNKEFALKALEGASKVRYLIALNGAEVHDLNTNEVIMSAKINVDTVKFFYKLAQKFNINLKFSTRGVTYYNTLQQAGIEKFHVSKSAHKQFFDNNDISGCVFYGGNYDVMHKVLKIIKSIDGVDVPYFSRIILDRSFVGAEGSTSIDVSVKGISKGSAVQFLQNKLEISAENCIAIGDEINDLSMFKHVGHAVVVQNAANEIKAVANEIIGANYEHGVAKFLTQFIKA